MKKASWSINMNKIRNNQGMTLVEIMVSLSIISIAILGLTRYQITSMDVNKQSREVMQAKIIAQDLMETLKIEPLLAEGSFYEYNGIYQITYTVKSGSPIPRGVQEITVKINWNHRVEGNSQMSIPQQVLFQAYRAK
jgi:prepilin-type N-terminal cleavage/methylation domain-containing protein